MAFATSRWLLSVPYPIRIKLRDCLKSAGCRESTQHETRHGEGNHRLTARRHPCIILTQTAGLIAPRPRAFDHPPPWEPYQTFGPVRPSGHAQAKPHGLGHPRHHLPTIRAIAPEQAELCARPSQGGAKPPGACRVGNCGSCDDHGQEPPSGINKEMALTALRFLATSVAAAEKMQFPMLSRAKNLRIE